MAADPHARPIRSECLVCHEPQFDGKALIDHLRKARGLGKGRQIPAKDLAQWVEIATVSARFGHSSVALTARTYAGVERSLKHDATDRLARRLTHPDRA
jgi:hypothetical protein